MDQIHGREFPGKKPKTKQKRSKQTNKHNKTEKTEKRLPRGEDFRMFVNTVEISHILLCCPLLETGTELIISVLIYRCSYSFMVFADGKNQTLTTK